MIEKLNQEALAEKLAQRALATRGLHRSHKEYDAAIDEQAADTIRSLSASLAERTRERDEWQGRAADRDAECDKWSKRAWAAEARVKALTEALQKTAELLKRRANCGGGWWNDAAIFNLNREVIEPALASSDAAPESKKEE